MGVVVGEGGLQGGGDCGGGRAARWGWLWGREGCKVGVVVGEGVMFGVLRFRKAFKVPLCSVDICLKG